MLFVFEILALELELGNTHQALPLIASLPDLGATSLLLVVVVSTGVFLGLYSGSIKLKMGKYKNQATKK